MAGRRALVRIRRPGPDGGGRAALVRLRDLAAGAGLAAAGGGAGGVVVDVGHAVADGLRRAVAAPAGAVARWLFRLRRHDVPPGRGPGADGVAAGGRGRW